MKQVIVFLVLAALAVYCLAQEVDSSASSAEGENVDGRFGFGYRRPAYGGYYGGYRPYGAYGGYYGSYRPYGGGYGAGYGAGYGYGYYG